MNKDLYYRLIALWIVCEAFAGGIMHGTHIPFTGLIVSGLAVCCIILIGYNFPASNAILKATILVAIFKLLLSPHSPPTAYIAVFFQGYVGHLLFQSKKHFIIKAILLGLLALAESAIQRILVLWIVYGTGFWEAFDLFIQKLAGTSHNYSSWLAVIYFLIHCFAGCMIGWYASRLAEKAPGWKSKYPQFVIHAEPFTGHIINKKKKRFRLFLVFTWLLLTFLLVQAYVVPGHSILPAGKVIRIILRTFLIYLTWYTFIAPILLKLLKKRLLEQEKKWPQAIKSLASLLPEIQDLFSKSWKLSSRAGGIRRFRLFLQILFINILTPASTA